MYLQWENRNGRSGHEAGLALLEKMYRQQFGRAMPQIAVTPQGKPYFPETALHFSISHTKDVVFCCLHDANVGIDAEPVNRKVSSRVAEDWLSEAEKQRYLAQNDKNAAFLRLWVLKESYAKLTGKGLGHYLKETDFDPEDSRIQCLAGCYVAVMTE